MAAVGGKQRKGNVLCFMLDTTQSMQNWIAAARTVLAEVVDISTLTQAFDAVGVMEYGDYDSVWCSQAHVKNAFGNDNVPMRFSGWGVLGSEMNDKRVVLAETARVDINSVYDFASHLKARGGGRVPEAVKTALLQLGHIAATTLNNTCRMHVIHLTDAPMHLDMKGLDSEGLKEKIALGSTPDDRSATSPFSAMNVFSSVLQTFALTEEELAPFYEEVKRGLAGCDPNGSYLVTPSRLHYTCVCNAPLVAGPFAVLAHLTGGNVVSPRNVEIGTLRKALQGILNTWMGLKVNDLKGNVCHLLFKNKSALVYSPDHGQVSAVAIPMDMTDDKLFEYCKCRRHDIVAVGPNSSVHEPFVTVQLGLKRSLQRCIARLRPPQEGMKVNRQAQQKINKHMEELGVTLGRVCTSPMALCSSPPLGKIWRAFTKRRGDPRRDVLLATLEKSKHSLSPEELAIFNEWNSSSYDSSSAIQKELRQFVESNGVKGLIYFDGADEGFVPKSLNNAFLSCDRESQALIMTILTRMRIDRQINVPSRAEAEAAKRAADATEGMEGATGSGRLMATSSECFFTENEEGDEDLEEFSDDEEGASFPPVLPFPSNAIPLNLPLPTLFRLVMSIAVPGAELSRRPSAIVAALALRSGSVLKVPAALYLQSICGEWLTWKTMEGATKGSKVPLVPENFVGAFMRTLLSASKTLEKLQQKGADKLMDENKSEGNADSPDSNKKKGPITSDTITKADHAQRLLRDPIFTRAEHMALNKLLRLSTMLRVDAWEVIAENIDVASTDGSAVDYTLDCVLCKKARPWSLVDDDGICGYCRDSRTQEGKTQFGNQTMKNPDYRPSAPQPPKNDKKKGKAVSKSTTEAKVPKTIPVRPAPPAASAESTFQVRCSGCHGYYSRDKEAIVVGDHKCHYCRNGVVPKEAKQKPSTESATAAHQVEDPPHIHRCNQCNNGFIGAPSRPLPNGTCAGCAAGIKPRRPTTTDRPTRIVKLFPFRLYWRDMAHGVGLRESEEWPAQDVPPQNSLPAAALAFQMPYMVSNDNDLHDIPVPDTTMPPNRWAEEFQRNIAAQSAQSSATQTAVTVPRSARHLGNLPFGPLPAIANAQKIWEHIITSIYGQRFGGEVPMCALCCEEFPSADRLHAVCGRKGCDQRMCYPCGKEWYSTNTIGTIIAPRKCFCPCCARAPAPKILKIHNPDAAVCGLPRQVQALDTDHFYVGWCVRCTNAGEHSAKNCEGARPEEVTEFVCEQCTMKQEMNKKWRHVCPQCKVPTIRISGCHHITCPCGCHWCYECGGDFTNGDVYGHSCPGREPINYDDEYESEYDDYDEYY